MGHFRGKCSPILIKKREEVGNQNLGINVKKFQYFYNASIISIQNHYNPLFISNRIILYDFRKKKSEKVAF